MQATTHDTCQSCGRPLGEGAARGTEPSGRIAALYCALCYAQGRFVDPDITEGEMVQRAATAMARDRVLPEPEARLRAERLIPSLSRWSGFGVALSRRWRTLLIRGLAAIVFGVLLLVWPRPSVLALLIVFGAFAFVDGLFALAAAFEGGRRAGLLAIHGIFGIAVGVLTFWRPGATLIALYALFAAWAIVTGILEIANGIRLRREISGEGWLILSGLLSIAFGVLLIALPSSGIVAVVWLMGIYGLALGIALTALAFRVRRLTAPAERAAPRPAPQPA